MANFKEIVTKAVIGKGKKTTTTTYKLKTEEMPNTILGCWIINHEFKGTTQGETVNVRGSFDVNVWYAYDNDTKTTVSTKKFHYEEVMTIKIKENAQLAGSPEVVIRNLRQPGVIEAKINGAEADIIVEKELGVELIGDAKVRVETVDDEDDYEELTETIEAINTSDIQEEYLN